MMWVIFSVSSHTQNKEEFKVVRLCNMNIREQYRKQFFHCKIEYEKVDGSTIIYVNVRIRLTEKGPIEHETTFVLEVPDTYGAEKLESMLKLLSDHLYENPRGTLEGITNHCWCSKCLASNDTRPIPSSVKLN